MAQEGYPVYPRAGVLIKVGNSDFGKTVTGAFSKNDAVTVVHGGGFTEEYPATDITVDENTGRLTFVSEGDTYMVREFAEDDGEWLSKYKILLPQEAVEQLIIEGKDVTVVDNLNDPNETLDAFASEDSVYVLGVIYTNGAGRWLREDGDWVLLSPNDNTFNDMIVMSIDPERATEFVDLYDRNYVTVADAEEFELNGARTDEE